MRDAEDAGDAVNPDVVEIMQMVDEAAHWYSLMPGSPKAQGGWSETRAALEAKVTELAEKIKARDIENERLHKVCGDWKNSFVAARDALAEAQAEIMRLKLSPAMELGYAREICKEVADLKAKIKQLESL